MTDSSLCSTCKVPSRTRFAKDSTSAGWLRVPSSTTFSRQAAKSGAGRKDFLVKSLIKMKKKLLLLIEDNPLLTSMYEAAFEKADFEVIFAHDGEAGLALVKDKHPDCVLLDLLMPGIDGLTVLERLKKDDVTKDIKVIVLTVVTKKEDLEMAKKLGAIDCLVKPELTLAEIVERVISHLGG